MLTLPVSQFYVAVCPVTGGYNDAQGFFMSYLALPVVIVFWLGGFAWKHTGWLTADTIDVDTGRREHDWDLINEYRAKVAAMPAWRRIIYHVFI